MIFKREVHVKNQVLRKTIHTNHDKSLMSEINYWSLSFENIL